MQEIYSEPLVSDIETNSYNTSVRLFTMFLIQYGIETPHRFPSLVSLLTYFFNWHISVVNGQTFIFTVLMSVSKGNFIAFVIPILYTSSSVFYIYNYGAEMNHTCKYLPNSLITRSVKLETGFLNLWTTSNIQRLR